MAERFQYPVWAAIDPETLDAPLRDEVQWFQEFSVPVLPIPSVASAPSFTIDPTTLDAVLRDEVQWFQEFSVPVLRIPSVAEIPSFTIDPEAFGVVETIIVTLDEFQPFSEPVLPLHQVRPGLFVTDPETIGDPLDDKIGWFQPLSEPLRRIGFLIEA